MLEHINTLLSIDYTQVGLKEIVKIKRTLNAFKRQYERYEYSDDYISFDETLMNYEIFLMVALGPLKDQTRYKISRLKYVVNDLVVNITEERILDYFEYTQEQQKNLKLRFGSFGYEIPEFIDILSYAKKELELYYLDQKSHSLRVKYLHFKKNPENVLLYKDDLYKICTKDQDLIDVTEVTFDTKWGIRYNEYWVNPLEYKNKNPEEHQDILMHFNPELFL